MNRKLFTKRPRWASLAPRIDRPWRSEELRPLAWVNLPVVKVSLSMSRLVNCAPSKVCGSILPSLYDTSGISGRSVPIFSSDWA
ncbi:hypothetical protein D3C81_1920750 [compost metagenome]